MGGLGAQAGTVGQEELIYGQLSKNVADMRLKVVNFAAVCTMDLGRLDVGGPDARNSKFNAGRKYWHQCIFQLDIAALRRSGCCSSWFAISGARVGEFEDYDFALNHTDGLQDATANIFKSTSRCFSKLHHFGRCSKLLVQLSIPRFWLRKWRG